MRSFCATLYIHHLNLSCLSSHPNNLFPWNQFNITVCTPLQPNAILCSPSISYDHKCVISHSIHPSQLTVSNKHYTACWPFSEFSFSKNAHQLRIGVILMGSNTEGTARLKRDGTCAETRFGLSAKWTSPFKLAGASVQSTTGCWCVRISGSNGSNAGYTVFWGRVQVYWLPTPLTCFPFTSPTVRHRVPSGFNWALTMLTD